jgi:hypothetical protein
MAREAEIHPNDSLPHLKKPMNKQAQLNESLSSIEVTIELFLTEEITRPYSSCKNLGGRLWGIVGMFRSRGILRFLLQADVDAFFEDMHRDALTYLTPPYS